MYLGINGKNAKTLVISLGLATILAACVNDNNAGGSTQYLTATSQKSAVKGLQLSTTTDYSTLRDVAKGNGIYVVVGDNGTIVTSKDGVNWQPQDGVVSENLSGVTYNTANKLFYAVGDAGLIISSTDGVEWTVYKNLIPSVKLNSVMSVKGDEVIAGESGNIFEIAVTSKRGMVTVRSLDEAANATSTSFNGSDTMVIGTASGSLYYKTYGTFSTANWLRTKTFTNMPISDISYDAIDSWITATTLNGAVVQSSDGKTWSSPILVDPMSKATISLNSIAIEPLTDRFLVVGGDERQNDFVRFSSDFNQWSTDSLPAKYQIQKVRCFDASSCVAVGDKKTLVVASKKSDLSGMDWKSIDLIQPRVELKSPIDNSIDNSTQPVIKLGFNKHVNNVSANTISLHEGSSTGPTIPLSNITTSENDFVFNPLVKLNDSTKYVVVVADGITDDSNYKTPATSFSFTTGDFTAPTVAELYPENGSTDIPVKPMIKLNFSELVKNVNTTNVTLHQDSPTGALIPISDITQDVNNVYMFTPAAALKEITKYYVVVNGNITDLHNNNLVATQFSFTTGDFTAPSVAILSPSDNATGVLTTASVQIKFSEPVSNVSKNTVVIRAGSITGTAIAIESVTAQADNVYAFTPVAGALDTDTKYYVTFNDGITDKSGNALTKTQFAFTTVKPAPQNITFSPIVGVKVGGSFDLVINTNWAESVEVTLPSGMTAPGAQSKFTCTANLSCKTTITVAANATAGNYLIQAVGLKSAFKYVGTVPVTSVTSYLASVANTKKVEICQLNSAGVTGCTITDLSSVLGAGLYGAAVSPMGNLYLLTTNSLTNPGAGVYKCTISNMKVTGCVQQSATGNAGITGGAFSIDGKYFYYNDMSKSTVNMCKVASNGDLTSCVVAKSGLQLYVQRLTLNYNGDRLFVNTGAGVMSCVIDAATGMFSSCIVNPTAGGTDVWGINFGLDNTRIYTTRSTQINICNYSRENNQVSGCAASTFSGSITGIAFTPTMAILTNANGNLQKCTLDGTGKLTTSCVALPGSTITATEGLAIFN